MIPHILFTLYLLPSTCYFRLVTFLLLTTFYFLPPPFFRSTQPSIFRCFPPLTASDPAGTFSRTVVPLPTYAPLPMVTGATSCESLPTNTPSSIVVWCLRSPS